MENISFLCKRGVLPVRFLNMKKYVFTGALLALLLGFSHAYAVDTNLKFDFGSGKTAKGYTKVTSENIYSDETGFGFDFSSSAEEGKKCLKGALKGDFMASDKPFYFSVKLPEGDYKVTLTLGNCEAESNTSLKAESRRLMLEEVKTKKGELIKKSVIINVRTPRINDKESVGIKKREVGYLNWDNKLTLEFNGPKPSVTAIEIEPAKVPTVFLAGNSTVTDQDMEPWASWGQMVTAFFKPEVVVTNYAVSGSALVSFKGSRRLKKILSVMEPGDYLFIEFGHNDMKRKGDGIGPWLSFSDLLREFITKAREKGGIPVCVAPMNRRAFDENGKVKNTHGEYPDAVRAVAKEMDVPLIDLHYVTRELYEAWGPEKSKCAFVHYPARTWPGQFQRLHDNSHFNNYGAYEIARCIVQGIKDNNLKLADYLLEDIPTFDYGHPDPVEEFKVPHSTRSEILKPDGN